MDSTPMPPGPARTALARRVVPPGTDGRRRDAKRFAELIHALAAKVPDPADPLARIRLVAAASLSMASERLAHRAAAGEDVDPDAVVRINNALDRALERLEGSA